MCQAPDRCFRLVGQPPLFVAQLASQLSVCAQRVDTLAVQLLQLGKDVIVKMFLCLWQLVFWIEPLERGQVVRWGKRCQELRFVVSCDDSEVTSVQLFEPTVSASCSCQFSNGSFW